MKRGIILLFLLMSGTITIAQEIKQSISGIVIDVITDEKISDATISLNGKNLKANITSDAEGKFTINDVPPGRYNLVVTHISYYSFIKSELLVTAGSDVFLEISMIFSATELEPVEITSEGYVPITEFTQPLSTFDLSVEKTNRIAANYNDPARLATSYAGVASDNDQANNLSIRGNSPNGMIWKLEGMEIVNPNHLTNAGTFSDRLTQTGGGVNILSRQLLGNSHLYTGAWGAKHGNATSGVFDINLRPGNKNRRSYTIQTGVLGIDISTEGPFNEKKSSSYLVNYRYSTVGLLSLIGVDLGDEVITFQDLSFNVDLPTKNAGDFTIFGIGGYSSNKFEADRDSLEWEFEKDRYDITYNSNMAALGLTHKISLAPKTSLRSSAVISAISGSREGERLDNDLDLSRLEYDTQDQIKISGLLSLGQRLGRSHQFDLGINFQYQDYNYFGLERSLTGSENKIDAEGTAQLYQPYVNWMWQIIDKIILNAGIHSMYYSLNEELSIEPRTSLHIQVHPRHAVKFSFGQHSQTQLPGTYFSSFTDSLGNSSQPNQKLDLSKSRHYVLGITNGLGQGWELNTELYYQDLYDIPVSKNPGSTFSTLNLFEGFVSDTLINKGTGKNYGIEMTLQKQLRKEYYFQLTYTLFNSTYSALDGKERDTRYNGNYVVAYSVGREMDISKDEKNRWLNINARVIARGGFRKTPIDKSASQISGETIFDESRAYSEQYKDYFRLDLGIALIKNKEQYTRTWSLDIQNLLNNENVAWESWDNQKQEIDTKNQLGIIPVLNFRLNF